MPKTLFIDTETTGLPKTRGWGDYYDPSLTSYYNDSRVIELAYIIYDEVFDEDRTIVKTVDELIIPDGFVIQNSQFHGITMEDAMKNGKYISDVLKDFESDLEGVTTIVAHNINFDMNLILSECYRSKNIGIVKKIESIEKICTMEIGKIFMESRKYPKLVELYSYLFNKTVEQKHRALSDTQICAECYYKMNP